MRYIKLFSMFVILVVALLLISTIGTYAGGGLSTPAVGIIQCDGNLLIVKSTLSSTDPDCCTGYDCDCQVGDRCEECLEECIEVGFSADIEQSGPGKVTFILVAD